MSYLCDVPWGRSLEPRRDALLVLSSSSFPAKIATIKFNDALLQWEQNASFTGRYTNCQEPSQTAVLMTWINWFLLSPFSFICSASERLGQASQVLVNVRYMLSPVRLSTVCHLSVCRLSSVTFVCPTQAVQVFGNISTALGTLAIRWYSLKILRRSSKGNASAGGVKHNRGSKI